MAQKQDIRTQLLTASPFQLMLSLSVPAIIGMVVVGLYNFMDRVFVGQLITGSRMMFKTAPVPVINIAFFKMPSPRMIMFADCAKLTNREPAKMICRYRSAWFRISPSAPLNVRS